MSKLPDFEGLAMFANVAEERSFAAAAKAIGVSVATVSRKPLKRRKKQSALTGLGVDGHTAASIPFRCPLWVKIATSRPSQGR